MPEFFSPDYSGPGFVSLGPPHIGALSAIVLLNLLLIWLGRSLQKTRRGIRIGLAAVVWTAEASWHIWNAAFGKWTAQTMLPLNLCSILIWLAGLMLLLRDFRIFEFAYFLGIGAALQYLATPDLGRYGFPHFRFFQAFTSHGLLLTAPIYMAAVEGFRPTWNSFKRVVIGANMYVVLIYFANLALGSDYLMLNAKPATPSLLDVLPAWPYYIPFMELIGLVSCLVLYLPFALRDARRARQMEPGRGL